MSARASALLYLALLALLTGLVSAALPANTSCRFGTNYVKVVGFTTLVEEEIARNPSWNQETNRFEGEVHTNGYLFWAQEANRVGITAGGITYCVNLTMVNIGSSPDPSPTGFMRTTVREWAINSGAHFFLAPFGTSMSEPVLSEMETHNKVVLSATASSVELFKCDQERPLNQPECVGRTQVSRRFEFAFGVQPPDDTDLIPFLSLARIHKASSIVSVSKNSVGSQTLGSGAMKLAEQHGIVGIQQIEMASESLSQEDFDALAEELKRLNADLLVAGTDEITCRRLAKSLEKVKWYPKAALVTCCLSDPEVVAPELRYLLDLEDWNPALSGHHYKDKYYFPIDGEIDAPQQLFSAYQNWSKQAKPTTWIGNTFAVGVLIHETVVRMKGVFPNAGPETKLAIQSITMYSVFGYIGFDAFGQNNDRDVLVVQVDRNLDSGLIFPLNFLSKEIVYPIPTTEERKAHYGSMNTTLDIIFASLAGFSIAVSIILLTVVWVHREKKILIASSPLFLAIILLGSILLHSTIFAWGLEASSLTCHLRYWLLGLGFVITFGALFAKTFRVMRIFGERSLSLFKISNLQLLMALGVLVLIEAILLAVFSGTSNPRSYVFIPDPDRPMNNEIRCKTKNNATPIMIALLIYNFAVALAGIWLSVKTWNLQAKLYNESRPIAISMYSIFCFGVLAVGLQLSNALNQRAMFAVRSVCILVATLTTLLVLFGPKALTIHKTEGLFRSSKSQNSTITTGTANSKTKSGPNNQSSGKSGEVNPIKLEAMPTSEDAVYWKNKFVHLAKKYKKLRKEARTMERDLEKFREEQF